MIKVAAFAVMVAAAMWVGREVGMLVEAQSALRDPADPMLVRAPDGRCWRAHGEVEPDDRALAWRTDNGLRVRVVGADWIEVVRGGGVNGQGLDWRGAAATLGVDLGACLPATWSAP